MKRGFFYGLSLPLSLLIFWSAEIPLWAEELPALPSGLEEAVSTDSAEPSLPEGLFLDEELASPDLPQGFDVGSETTVLESTPENSFHLPAALGGFWEARLGLRTQSDPNEKAGSIGETRLQLQFEQPIKQALFQLTSDFLYDPVVAQDELKLESGNGFIDLREANLLFRPMTFLDFKVGRQILTWGTGDLIFINDLFPKDWNAFFIGRDTEYLKAPSDALKASFFSKWLNLDIVYTPRFDADRFIDGRRLSFFNPALSGRSGRNAVIQTETPDRWFQDDELALRLHQNVQGLELALYGYRGYWKSPGGFNSKSNVSIFPRLSVYGASLRGPLAKGIGYLELGFYDSEADRKGENPFIRNSEFRALLGYEQEVGRDLTASVQYYLEQLHNYDQFLENLPSGSAVADENRHVFTLRLTQFLMHQELRLSLFTFYSPSDEDVYLRPKLHYKINDAWSGEIGGNLFLGKEAHTFFSQFEKNNNVYVGIRFSF